jgi:tetratricopeptide (TPR) repeat protein
MRIVVWVVVISCLVGCQFLYMWPTTAQEHARAKSAIANKRSELKARAIAAYENCERNSYVRQQFSAYIKAAPFDFEGYLYRARVELIDQPLNALSDCSKAIELKPNCAEAYLWRSAKRDEMGQKELALEDAKRAVAVCPRPHTAKDYINRAEALEGIRNLTEARLFSPCRPLDNLTAEEKRAFARLSQKPKTCRDWLELAELRDWDGNETLALAALGQAIQANPASPAPYSYRGQIHSSLSRKDAGKAGHLQIRERQLELAIADYNRALQIDPNCNCRLGLACCKTNKGDLKGALSDCKTDQILHPYNWYDTGSTHEIFRDLLIRAGDKDAAVRDITELISIRPSAVRFKIRAGYMQSLGKTDLAIADLSTAIAIAPSASLYADRSNLRMKAFDVIGAVQDALACAKPGLPPW